jgi:hypothetical protein
VLNTVLYHVNFLWLNCPVSDLICGPLPAYEAKRKPSGSLWNKVQCNPSSWEALEIQNKTGDTKYSFVLSRVLETADANKVKIRSALYGKFELLEFVAQLFFFNFQWWFYLLLPRFAVVFLSVKLVTLWTWNSLNLSRKYHLRKKVFLWFVCDTVKLGT